MALQYAGLRRHHAAALQKTWRFGIRQVPGRGLANGGGQASVAVQNQLGEQFTINFMKDYINATNREVDARLEGDTWILRFANGEVWEVPLAAINGG